MLNLTLSIAEILLSNKNILAVIRRWTNEYQFSHRKPDLDRMFKECIHNVAHEELYTTHYNQVDLACNHLASKDRIYLGQTPTHGNRPPTGYIQGSLSLHSKPFFMASMETLAEHILCDDHGRISLRWESLDDSRGIMRRIEISQLTAFVMAEKWIFGNGLLVRPTLREIYEWAHDSVIPQVACGALNELGRKGLVEVHRHFNISLHPILIWSALMLCNRFPADIEPEVIRWVKRAQWLRYYFIVIYNGQMCPRMERTLLQILGFPDSHLDLTPIPLPFSTFSKRANSAYEEAPFERQLLFELFRLVLVTRSAVLEAAVFTYCILQNLVYGNIVMGTEGGVGLDKFVALFASSRLRSLADHEVSRRLVQAYRTGRVFWLEARLTPEDPAMKVDAIRDAVSKRRGTRSLFRVFRRRKISSVETLYKDAPNSLPAVGLVLHFVKRKNRSISLKSIGSRLPPRNYIERFEAWQQADSVVDLVTKDLKAAEMILGFDVAGSEACTSMDTFACHVRFLNMVGRPLSGLSLLGRHLPEQWYAANKTQVTCHAGEDFNHILMGMRHIDEALEFFLLQKYDRIGHGTALGINPTMWAERMGRRSVHLCGEWLDDLVWFHHWLAKTGEFGDVRHQIFEQIERLARIIYERFYHRNRPMNVEELYEAWQLRSEEPPESYSHIIGSVPPSGFITSRLYGGRRYGILSRNKKLHNVSMPPKELWLDFHTDAHVRNEWYKTIEIDLDPKWDTAIEVIQSELLKKLVKSHVVIEVNPSSNVTLGPIDHMKEHPVFRWVDPRSDFMSQEGPMVAVGTDDPSVFATELIHEYAFLGRAAEELGATHRQVFEWLEYLRESGIRYSFFPRASFKDA